MIYYAAVLIGTFGALWAITGVAGRLLNHSSPEARIARGEQSEIERRRHAAEELIAQTRNRPSPKR